jgi:Lrp/AsnC family transcriptional regulator, regulator for asnA, asnC and gidA
MFTFFLKILMTSIKPYQADYPELDQTDQNIIELLRVDGRMSFTEIAKRLEMPEATARYRVQRLLQTEVIQVLAWPNPQKLGTPYVNVIFLTVENSAIDAVASSLAAVEAVRFVAVTSGRYNIIIDVFFGAHEELISFFNQLKTIPGIISYESQFVLNLLKAEYKYTLS